MKRGTQWLVVVGGAGALAAAVAAGVALAPSAVGVGIPAPDFRATDVASGDSVSLARFKGDVLLVNIWATWCTPCEQEMPEIERLYDELGPEGLRVLAVSVDEQGSDVVRAWTRKRHLTFTILYDPGGKIERLYQTIGLPESFVIDRSGRIVKRVTGFVVHWDDDTQKALFRRLLAQKREPRG